MKKFLKLDQRMLDTAQAIVLAVMAYQGWQDTTGKKPLWMIGLILVAALCALEDDPKFFRMIEAGIIVGIPITYFMFNANVGWGICVFLLVWNSLDIVQVILSKVLALKYGIHAAAKNSGKKTP